MLLAGADRAQEKTIADTKRPIAIPTEQEAVAPEAYPNPSEVSVSLVSHSLWHSQVEPRWHSHTVARCFKLTVHCTV
jgi:hypothetical protein